MIILSYGYKKPQNPDTGAVFWPALEFDIQRLNDHTHNGVDSAPLVKTQTISSASWGADLGGGSYRQLITLPNTASTVLTFDAVSIEIRLASGTVIYPTIEKVSSTTYYIYTNDNSLTYTAVYT